MGHTCHWIGCRKEVPESMWGCTPHWFALPAMIRRNIWASYRPGQEIAKDPSRAYVKAAMEARKWILAQQQKVGDV